MKGENQMAKQNPTPVLPSVYQETLTYGETLGVVAQKVLRLLIQTIKRIMILVLLMYREIFIAKLRKVVWKD